MVRLARAVGEETEAAAPLANVGNVVEIFKQNIVTKKITVTDAGNEHVTDKSFRKSLLAKRLGSNS